MPAQIDHAISMGARLDHPDVYERNAMVIAVRANRHDALPVLAQRGALSPVVPPDGVDLLMEACRHGNEAMAKVLVEVVGITTEYTDAQGRSALHYAVRSGSPGLVRYLLSAGADPDNVTLVLEATENRNIFGNAYPLTAKEVTPLMMALALGYDAIASALLDAGADPNRGGCSPLILAACHDRRALFAELLFRGATLERCQNWLGNEGVDACIYARMPVAFLGQLVDMYDFTADNGTIMSPLGSAVSLHDEDTVALLLACGAPVENHKPNSEFFTLWEQALPPRQSHSPVLDLLTARVPIVIPTVDMQAIEHLLALIADKIDEPESLASRGIFTSLLPEAAASLRQLARRPYLNKRQRSLEVAWTLSRTLPNLPVLQAARHFAQRLPHESWQYRTALQRHRQCTSLRQAADHLINECIRQLKASTEPGFFAACLDACPNGLAPTVHIANQIATLSGAPDPVISLIREAWRHAVEWSVTWNVAPENPDEQRNSQATLARTLLKKGLENAEIDRTPLVDLCLNALQAALASQTDGLGQFCNDPANWLGHFGQRHASSNSGNSPVHELQRELGLPRRVCEGVWGIWEESCRPAQGGGHPEPHTLARALALGLPRLVLNEHTRDIIPQSAKLRLLQWRLNVLAMQPASPGAGNRPAAFEAPDGPPRTEPKN